MAKAASLASTFEGFDRNAMQFWHELAIEMNREWFADHKARYQALWVDPMAALLGAVRVKLVRAYQPLELGEPKVMRIHRDVRFATDKTPYKTHIGGVITVAGTQLGEGGIAALYVHLGLDAEFVGAGCYQFDAGKLAKWRKHVAGKAGVELAALVHKLRAAGYEVGGHDDYKKVPKGLDPDHPRAELLKLRGLTVGFPAIPRGLLHEPGLVAWIATHGIAAAPLVRWLHHHVG